MNAARRTEIGVYEKIGDETSAFSSRSVGALCGPRDAETVCL